MRVPSEPVSKRMVANGFPAYKRGVFINLYKSEPWVIFTTGWHWWQASTNEELWRKMCSSSLLSRWVSHGSFQFNDVLKRGYWTPKPVSMWTSFSVFFREKNMFFKDESGTAVILLPCMGSSLGKFVFPQQSGWQTWTETLWSWRRCLENKLHVAGNIWKNPPSLLTFADICNKVWASLW